MANNPNNISFVSVNSAPIVNLVKQCCDDEPSFQELYPSLLDHVRSNKQSAPKQIVDTVKSLIKDRKVDSPSKVLALKLLHLCVMEDGGCEEFMGYIEKKILNRLTVLAKYKKDSNDIEKGATLFGKGPNTKASADFMKLLLLYIQQWGTRFSQINGKQSEISKIYQQLMTKEKIHFPSEQAVMESLCPNYQAYGNVNTQNSNATSTAPQSLNHSDFISGGAAAFGTNISMMTDLGGTANQSTLSASVRQSMNLQIANKYIQSNTTTGGQPQQQTKEEQAQLAQRIRQDYKKLSEYQSTAKLVKEVIGEIKNPKEMDSELVGQFKEQLLEGKQFTENFLKIIMEVPIKDRDTKVQKVLGIIADIEEQLKKINTLMTYHEETKRGENIMSKSTNEASANMASKESRHQEVSQSVELKGILKKENNRFSSNNTDFPAQSARNEVANMPLFEDFKFDQNAFKTNFAASINPKLMKSNGGGGNWFSQEQPPQEDDSSIFDMFSQKKEQNDPFSPQVQVPQPPIQGFDFGFDNFVPQVNQSVIVDQKPVIASFDNWGFGNSDVNQSQIVPPSKPLATIDTDRKGSNDSSTLRQQKSFKSAKSFRSNNGEIFTGRASDQFGVIKNVSQHQPQITQRSPDSNPMSDQDEGKISDNDDRPQVEFNIPPAMNNTNQSLIMRQSGSTKKKETFEKFDFSEVALPSQRSGLSREDPVLTQKLEQLEIDLKTAKDNEISQKIQIKKLEHIVSEMTQDIIRLKKCEARLEDVEIVSMQVEQQMRIVQKEADEYKKQAEKMESKAHKAVRDQENAMIEVLQLRKEKQDVENDMTAQKTSHDAINLQIQRDLNNSRQNEEQLRNQLVESKKREEYMKDQWLQDLKKHQAQVDDWQDRELDLQNQISERDEEITKLKSIIADLKREIAEAQQQTQSQQVAAPQQKLVIKSSQIKLTSSFVSSKHGSPKPFSNQSSQVKSMTHNQTLSETKFDFIPKNQLQEVEVETPSFEPVSSTDIQLREPQPVIEKFEEEVKNDDEIIQMAVADSPESHSSVKESDQILTAVKVESKPIDFFFEDELKQVEKQASPKAHPFDFNFTVTQEVKDNNADFFDSLSDHQPNPPSQITPKKESLIEISQSPLQAEIIANIEEEPVIINSPKSELSDKIKTPPKNDSLIKEASPPPKSVSPVQEIKEPSPITVDQQIEEPVIIQKQEQNITNIEEPTQKIEEKLIKEIIEKQQITINVFEEEKKSPEKIIQQSISPINVTPTPVVNQVIQEQKEPQKRKYSDPFEEATVLMQSPQQIVKKQMNNNIQQMSTNQSMMNQSFDKSVFNTVNTENFHKNQIENPINTILNGFFRKSLMTHKTVLYEDPNVQIGLVADFSNISLIRMRLFFGNKSGPTLQHLSFKYINPSPSYLLNQSRHEILNLSQGQQEPIDINFGISSFLIASPPIFNLSYNGQSFLIKIPLFTLKFCSQVPQLDNPAAYIKSWQQLEKGEAKLSFNLDFNACRSLTQLKETLKIGKNAMNFPEGVETAKNVVSGVTMLQIPNQIMLVCLVKITMTVDGRNCEIVGRSNDITPIHGPVEEHGKFAKVIVSNVLEMIALRK